MKKVLSFFCRLLVFLLVTVLLLTGSLYACLFVCIRGPSRQLSDLVVMSANEASFTKLLLPLWLSRDELSAVIARNSVADTDQTTDTSLVTVLPAASGQAADKHLADTEYDTSVEVRDGMELHHIAGATWSGIMLIVQDPARVFVGTSADAYNGAPGITVPKIAEKYDALAAVNGAFFVDEGGVGDGSSPLGFVFSQGGQLAGGTDTAYKMIGFTADNILVCGDMTGAKAKELGIRDGLSCRPYLIINGQPADISGAGSGLNPRTALGQRADGAVLLLVIDGRQAHSLGASLADLEEVMLAFGAVNAGNLDGGGSTALYYDGEILNNCTSVYGMRGIPDAICVKRK